MSKPKPPTPPTAGGGAQPAGGCVQDCKCKPISAVQAVSLEYVSDHKLLRQHFVNWKNEGSIYSKPEWIVGKTLGHPISHTMDKNVSVKIQFRVEPSDACPESGTLEGQGTDELVFAPIPVAFKPGLNTMELTTSTKLKKAVKSLRFNVNWIAKTVSGTFSSSTANFILVTVDTPLNEGKQEDGVTLKRMWQAIELVEPLGTTDSHAIIAGLMKKLPFYTLERDPWVPLIYNHPTYFNSEGGAWPIADYISSAAECQAIVRFVRGVIKQLGCPGKAEAVVIWADPDVNNGKTVLENPFGDATLHNKKKVVGGVTWFPALAARDPKAVGTVFRPGSMMNMYEACLKFEDKGVTKYYGGGAGVYDTKEEVIKAFSALVWFSRVVDGATGNPMNRIEEIVQRY